MTASTAARTVRSNSNSVIEKNPSVRITSCIKATTAPIENLY